MLRTKGWVFCSKEGILEWCQNKCGVFCAEEHQMMCIVGTVRREDSP